MITCAIVAFSLGVILLSGLVISFGVEPELASLDLPSVPVMGYMFLCVAVLCLLPPWVRSLIWKPFRAVVMKIRENKKSEGGKQ